MTMFFMLVAIFVYPPLKLTVAPEHSLMEDRFILLGWPIFRGDFLLTHICNGIDKSTPFCISKDRNYIQT